MSTIPSFPPGLTSDFLARVLLDILQRKSEDSKSEDVRLVFRRAHHLLQCEGCGHSLCHGNKPNDSLATYDADIHSEKSSNLSRRDDSKEMDKSTKKSSLEKSASLKAWLKLSRSRSVTRKASMSRATSSSESETDSGKSSIVNKRTFDSNNNSGDSRKKIELGSGSDNLGHKDDSESNFHVQIKWFRPPEIDLPSSCLSPRTISSSSCPSTTTIPIGKTSREGSVSLDFHGRCVCLSDLPLQIPLESSAPCQDPRLGKAVASTSTQMNEKTKCPETTRNDDVIQ